MGRRKKGRIDADGSGFGGSLGDLLAARGLAPAASSEASAPTPAPGKAPGQPTALDLSPIPKLVVRRTRKGRGGRTATLIEGLDSLSAPDRKALAKAVRGALGTGAKVEGDIIAVQGDVGDRLADWLTARGARRVVVS